MEHDLPNVLVKGDVMALIVGSENEQTGTTPYGERTTVDITITDGSH